MEELSLNNLKVGINCGQIYENITLINKNIGLIAVLYIECHKAQVKENPA